jgi:predicted MPP superfamily phosphohydrolase
MLSGHTHGGQIHSQKYGSITLSRRMKNYAAGLYEFGPQRLYVNKGVGYGWRIRYNRRPEIAVFDLVGGEDQPEAESPVKPSVAPA